MYINQLIQIVMKLFFFFSIVFLSFLLLSCSASHDLQPGVYDIVDEPEAGIEDTGTSSTVLKAGDEVKISVWRVEGLNQTAKIDMHGNINVMLLGEVPAEGLTTEELRAAVTRGLKKYYKNPVVSITLESLGSQEYFVAGAIRNSGNRVLEKKTSALEAIISAGGVTDDADKFLLLIRKKENSLRVIKASFDLASIEKGRFNAHQLILAQGDIVYVPSSRKSNLEKAAQTLSTLLSPIIDIERMIMLWPKVMDALEDKNEVTFAF